MGDTGNTATGMLSWGA
jgi:hypothetical protein